MTGEVFGPVESRRFGYSLGINHLPEKICSYSCMYCQLGRTRHLTITRHADGDPVQIFHLVETRLKELSLSGHMPDTITLVPNGEPTLDKNMGAIISQLKIFRIPIAVITNGSLLWQKEVRDGLADADIVSVKVDSIGEKIWKKINRPHGSLKLNEVLEGIRIFSKEFKGRLITETMLISGMNDDQASAMNLTQFLQSINHEEVYLSLPLRPPAEMDIRLPSKTTIASATEVMRKNGILPILMSDLPESDIDKLAREMADIVKIIKVHPLPKKEVLKVMKEMGITSSHWDKLIEDRVIVEKFIQGKAFFAYNHERD